MYKIGQVLYIISNSTRTIEPVQVHSKQTLESFEGTTVQHMCMTTKKDRISLEKQEEKGALAGVFTTIDEAEAHLLQTASEMVRSLANVAREKASTFNTQSEPAISDSASAEAEIAPSAVVESGDIHSVTLENGVKARLHLPADMS